MNNFDIFSFEHAIHHLRSVIREMYRAEKNIGQTIIHLAGKLREKNIKLFGKDMVFHSSQLPKSLKNEKKSRRLPLAYLVLLKKNNTLAVRINYPGNLKEQLIEL